MRAVWRHAAHTRTPEDAVFYLLFMTLSPLSMSAKFSGLFRRRYERGYSSMPPDLMAAYPDGVKPEELSPQLRQEDEVKMQAYEKE